MDAQAQECAFPVWTVWLTAVTQEAKFPCNNKRLPAGRKHQLARSNGPGLALNVADAMLITTSAKAVELQKALHHMVWAHEPVLGAAAGEVVDDDSVVQAPAYSWLRDPAEDVLTLTLTAGHPEGIGVAIV